MRMNLWFANRGQVIQAVAACVSALVAILVWQAVSPANLWYLAPIALLAAAIWVTTIIFRSLLKLGGPMKLLIGVVIGLVVGFAAGTWFYGNGGNIIVAGSAWGPSRMASGIIRPPMASGIVQPPSASGVLGPANSWNSTSPANQNGSSDVLAVTQNSNPAVTTNSLPPNGTAGVPPNGSAGTTLGAGRPTTFGGGSPSNSTPGARSNNIPPSVVNTNIPLTGYNTNSGSGYNNASGPPHITVGNVTIVWPH
jgi:hypothetical protein